MKRLVLSTDAQEPEVVVDVSDDWVRERLTELRSRREELDRMREALKAKNAERRREMADYLLLQREKQLDAARASGAGVVSRDRRGTYSTEPRSAMGRTWR